MTQKDEDLLLKDISTRLPYGVFAKEEIPSLLEEPITRRKPLKLILMGILVILAVVIIRFI